MIKQMLKRAGAAIAPRLVNRVYLKRHSEQEVEIALLPALVPQGGLAIDIGANHGLYIHHLLRRTGRIIAFEPLPPMQRWIRRCYGSKIDLNTVALSDQPGALTIRFPRGNYSWATVAPTNHLEMAPQDQAIEELQVEVRTLDSFGIRDAAFIKIDVEGHEAAVLRGASATLQSHPALLIESEERHCAGAPHAIRAFLEERGYRGLFIDGNRVRDMAEFDPVRDQPAENVSLRGKIGRYINNFIFVKAEDVERYRAALQQLHGA